MLPWPIYSPVKEHIESRGGDNAVLGISKFFLTFYCRQTLKDLKQYYYEGEDHSRIVTWWILIIKLAHHNAQIQKGTVPLCPLH